MLAENSYSQEYIDECGAKLDAQAGAYRELAAVERDLTGKGEARLRAAEGKNGTPLNEVRLLSTSLLSNGGTLVADKQIELDPARSVLMYAVGDEIALGEADFGQLAKAFFAELESRCR